MILVSSDIKQNCSMKLPMTVKGAASPPAGHPVTEQELCGGPEKCDQHTDLDKDNKVLQSKQSDKQGSRH